MSANDVALYCDAHTHLDPRVSRDLGQAASQLDHQLASTGCDTAIVLHLERDGWSAEDFCVSLRSFPRLIPFVTVDPHQKSSLDLLEFLVKDRGARGLKLHPRLSGFRPTDPAVIRLVQRAGALEIPVVIDAFFDWHLRRLGVEIGDFGRLAEACTSTRISIAHMGAPHVHETLAMARTLTNVYVDISFSLLYYRGSSISQDILYGIKSLAGKKKVMYGSDYPDRSVFETWMETQAEIAKIELSDDQRLDLLTKNFRRFTEIDHE